MLTSDYSSEEGEREDLPSRPSTAHEIYKQAGDWWKYVFQMLQIHIMYLLKIFSSVSL